MGLRDRIQAFLQPSQVKINPAYQGMVAYSNLPQAKRMEDNYRTYAREGYTNDSVYKCIRYIAFNGAAIPPKLYTDRTMQKEIEDHPLLDKLNKLNNEQSGLQYRESILAYKLLSGNSFQYSIRPAKNGPPAELWSIRPDLISVMTTKSRGITGYKYEYLEDPIDPACIGHTKYWHPEDEILGLSPLKVAGLMVDQQHAAKTWNLALLQNSARPSGAWVVPTPLSVNDRARLEEALRNKLQGYKNAGTPPVLDAGLTWQSMASTPGELEYLAGIQYNAVQIANIYSIAPQLIGDTSASTYDNMTQAQGAAYTEAIFPELDDLYGLWNVWILPMYPDLKNAFLYYDKESVEVIQQEIQAKKDSQADRSNNFWKSGMVSMNEARELAGLKPLPQGNVFFFPNTGKIIEQESIPEFAEQSAAPPPPPIHMLPPGASPATDGNQQLPPQNPEDQQEEEQAKAILDYIKRHKQKHWRDNDEFPPDEMVDLIHVLRKWREEDEQEDRNSTPESHNRRREIKALDLHTAGQKQAYIDSLERLRANWEESATTKLQDYFTREHNAVARVISPGSVRSVPVDWSGIVDKALDSMQPNLKKVMMQIYKDTAEDSAQQTLKSFKAQAGPPEHKDDSGDKEDTLQNYLDVFGPDVLAYLFSFAAQRVQYISETTRKMIQAALMEGVVEGESIPNLAKRIEALYLDQIIPNRSVVIARTETLAASNYGSLSAAKQSGLTLSKVWLATGDNRTRSDHMDADGQEVGIDEAFEVGDSKLMFPGDSSLGASAKEIVQCRCTTYYNRVTEDDSGNDGDQEEKYRRGYRAFVTETLNKLA